MTLVSSAQNALSFVLLSLALSVASWLTATDQAWGWSRYAHETTGHLAQLHLTPQARAGVEALLGDESLGEVAAWADQVRGDRRDTAPFHYVNGPRDQLRPDDDDLNLPQGTVYTAVLKYQQELRDERLPKAQRIEALKFLVHFVGDIHQPLHTGFGDDRGGNDFEVVYRDEPYNLHRYWDLNVIEPRLDRFSSSEYAEFLNTTYSEAEKALWITQTDPKPWVIEARRYIFAGLYPVPRRYEYDSGRDRAAPIAVMDDTYREVWMATAELQLARSGLRLAGILNGVFADPVE
ncbi:MAG: S1/P1 nuclease [Wenzhouxiangella sp.]|nr:S1/P1 nuclease [Wenzhouxiangella sp.]